MDYYFFTIRPLKKISEGMFMNTCEFKSSCTLFNELKERSPAIHKAIKEDYCDSGYSECARFIVSRFHGPERVSKYLFPEDTQEACKMLDEFS